MKKALITGVTGQDGSYLAEFLLQKGYEVVGIVRPSSMESPDVSMPRICHILNDLKLIPASLDNAMSLSKILRTEQPDEIYHLAAQSYVGIQFEAEFNTFHNNASITHYLLAAIREESPDAKLFFAGSSEMFGACKSAPQSEETEFLPRSIYGVSKLAAYHLLRNYRELYNLNACTGIMYNHESPRRGMQYVTRKITHGVARIHSGLQDKLELGNLDSKRDWGYSPDYVQAMWMMLQQEECQDYVIATGKLHTIRELLDIAFSVVNLNYRDYVITNPSFYRPAEKVPLQGNITKIGNRLKWKPKIEFKDMIIEMVEHDLRLVNRTSAN